MGALTTEDRFAIHELLARYCRYIDQGRWEEFASLFTPDCKLDLGRMGTHEGPAGVRQFTDTLQSIGLLMRHYTTNVIISGDGDRARVEAHILAVTGAPGSAQTTTGFYEDDVQKVGGRWLFRARRALIDLPS